MAMWGKNSASAMPIRADCTAASRSARRTSGRRRSRSAGMPTTTSAGAWGMVALSPNRGRRSRGGIAIRMQRRFLRLAISDLEDGDQRLRGGQVGLRPLHVQVRNQALAEAKLHEPERLLLQGSVLAGQLDAFLQRTHLDVVGGDLGLQQDQGVVVAVDLGVQRGVGRLDPAAEAAPEVQLPGGVHADRKVVEFPLDGEDVERVGAVAVLVPVVLGNRRLLLRKKFADGDAKLGPRSRIRSPATRRVRFCCEAAATS